MRAAVGGEPVPAPCCCCCGDQRCSMASSREMMSVKLGRMRGTACQQSCTHTHTHVLLLTSRSDRGDV